MSRDKEILLGYEVGIGKEVYLSFHHTVVTGMTQLSGKCLCGDGEIQLLNGGRVTVEEAYKLGESIQVLSLDDDWKIMPDEVIVYKDVIKPVFEIKLKDGRKTRLSLDHPLRLLDDWSPLSEIKLGDYLAVPRTYEQITACQEDIPDSALIVMAHMIADGGMIYSPRFTKKNPIIVDDLNKALSHHGLELHKVGDIDYCLRQLEKYAMPFKKAKRIGSAGCPSYGYWKAFCKQYDLKPVKSSEKRVPSSIFTLTNNKIATFLSRLFGDDGIYTKGTGLVGYSSTSEKLLSQVGQLLLRFGIRVVHSHKYEVTIVREDTEKFFKYIGFFGRAITPEAMKHSGTYDIIPIKTPQLKRFKNHWIRAGKRKGFPSRKIFGRYASYLLNQDYMNLARSDVYWDKVESITYLGELQTYDATTKWSRNLIVDDIFVHNTTALEALVERSKARAVAFLTKRGESGFRGQREIPPYFKEQRKGTLIDWQYVSAILEATMSEKMKFERSWIIKVCKGARSLQQVYQNIKSAQADARRSLDESIYENLAAYFEIILPEMEKYAFSERLNLKPGFNVLNLVGMADEMQQLVIESVIGYVLKNLNDTVVIIPEAHKFIPEGRNTPVKATALRMIREGAAVGDYLWIDTQETTSVSKALLKQCSNWIMGYQQEKNEVSNVRDNLGKRNITEEQIMSLKIGHFMVSLQQKFYHVYVLPSGIDPEMGRRVALGEMDVDEVRRILNGRKKPVTDAIARSFKLIEENKIIIPDAAKLMEGEGSSLGPGLFDSQIGLTEINERLTKTLEALDKAEIRTNKLGDEVDMRMADIGTMQKIIEVKNTHIDDLHSEIYWLKEDLFVYESFKLQLVDFILPPLKRANIFQSVPDGEGKIVKMITEQEIEILIEKRLAKLGKRQIVSTVQGITGIPWLEVWLPKLDGMQQKIIRKMAEKFPLTLTKSDISLSTGYSSRGGSFNNALSKLVRAELLVKDGEKYKLAQGPPE